MAGDPHSARIASAMARARSVAVAAVAVVVLGAGAERIGAWWPGSEAPLAPDALAAIARDRAPREGLLMGRALPLSAARARDWRLIPGVGPRTAEALERARPASVGALETVRGLGPAKRARIARLAF